MLFSHKGLLANSEVNCFSNHCLGVGESQNRTKKYNNVNKKCFLNDFCCRFLNDAPANKDYNNDTMNANKQQVESVVDMCITYTMSSS